MPTVRAITDSQLSIPSNIQTLEPSKNTAQITETGYIVDYVLLTMAECTQTHSGFDKSIDFDNKATIEDASYWFETG